MHSVFGGMHDNYDNLAHTWLINSFINFIVIRWFFQFGNLSPYKVKWKQMKAKNKSSVLAILAILAAIQYKFCDLFHPWVK